MNYTEAAKSILELVGGAENIESVKHCVTRLRFVLKDESVAKTEELKKRKEVMSVIQQMGQYQVVIGQEVGNVFAELEKQLGNPNADSKEAKKVTSAEDVKVEKREKNGIAKYLANMISSSFIPIIGIFAGSGFIKALLVILTTAGILSADGNTYTVLYAVADAVFYFFPVFLGYTSMKFFGGNPFLGMVLGAAMLYPSITAAAPDIFGAYTEGSQITQFLGIPVTMIAYSNTVFPIVVGTFVATKLEKLCKKIIPQVLQLFITPAIVLSIVFPLTLIVLGPAVSGLSNILANVSLTVYDFSPVFCGLVLAGIWVFVIMFGLHWAFIPLYINNMMTFGYEPLEGLLFAPLFAYVGICLAIAVKTKDKEFRSLNISCAIQSLLGCSEPALYGVLLPLKKPLVVNMIASGIGGAVAGAMHTVYYGAGITGIFAVTLAISPEGIDLGFWGMIVSALVVTVIAFVLTFVTYKGELPGEDA